MVNDSIDNLRLDINKPKVKASISVRKGDTKTRTIHIALTSNGAVYSLENVLMAEMLIVKPDGKVCDQDMVIKGNELQYTFRTQDTNVVGTCVCQIRLTFTDGAYLTSPEFYMYVYNMILSQDTSKSENEYSQTDALLSKANEYYENAKNLAETVEANLNDAIDARDGAEVAAEAAALSEANAAASAEEAKITIRPATPTEVGTVKPDGTTITVDLDGTIHATGNTSPIATTTTAGIVIPDGTTITVDADGTIHGANDTPIATVEEVGTVKPDGTTITIDLDGTIHGASTTPIATTEDVGSVKPDGVTITIDEDGVIKATGNTSPIATTSTAGIVIPDGTSITVDVDGTIHATETQIATTEDAGSVKPDGVTITVDEDGVIKATGNTSPIATTTTAGIVIPDGTTITVDADGTIHGANDTPIATTEEVGSVKPDGTTITVDLDGTLHATGNTSPIATTTTAGIVIPDGTTITVDVDGTIHGANATPIATTEEVGSVKPDGTTITVDLDGTLHATGNTSPIATTTTAGIVIPDGTTITVDGDGTIHAESIIDDTTKADNTTYSSNKIDSIVTDLETNFQDGVDAIYDACVSAGSTPDSKALTDIVDAIGNIANVGPANSWQDWAKAGGVDTSLYSSLSQLLDDEVAIRRLMTVHASADYLLNWVNTDESIMSTFIADTNAMKWIGLRDYICDKLMAIDSIKTAMLNSDNWEYILKDHVPVMTSNTAPYGEAYGNGTSSTYLPFNAFDNNDTTLYGGNSGVYPSYIGYKFINPICVRKVYIKPVVSSSNHHAKDVTIEGSNDGSTYVTIKTITLNNTDESYIDIDNHDYYLYYRINCTSSYANSFAVYTTQFYGRSLNVSVPTMTSNTAPWGEASASSIYSSNYEAWKAFTPTVSDGLRWVTTKGTDTAWINYNFNKKVVVKLVAYVSSYITVENKVGDAILQGSNDGVSWDNIQNIPLDNLSLLPKSNNIDNDKAYQYYRMNITNANVYSSGNYCGFSFLQFYGVDYSEREFAEGSTMKYLYDHGVELVPIDTYTTNTGVVEKRDNEIYLYQGTNAQSIANIHTQSSIDLSPYSIERCIVGDEFIQNSATSSHWLGYANNTTGNAIGYSYIYPYIPNHAYIDVSSVNGVYYPTIAQNNINTSKTIITEWWLE